MSLPENLVFQWPQKPPLPPLHQPVAIRVATPRSRRLARPVLRAALRELLASWSGLSPERLPLQETARGPVWPGPLAGHPLDISLAYGENAAWMGLLRGGSIGLDAMMVAPVAEAEAVAAIYLGPAVLAGIQKNKNPARAFALAWTGFEARLKCLKLELTEPAGRPPLAGPDPLTQEVFIDDDRIVTVVTARQPPGCAVAASSGYGK